MVTCHGCHGPIGQDQHKGSATGKQYCTLKHSVYCRGGVVEDESWRACIPGYTYDANLDLVNGPGFESTLNTFNFQPSNMQQQGPAFSTPAVPSSGDQQQQFVPLTAPTVSSHHSVLPNPHMEQQSGSLGAISRHPVPDRFPGMVNLGSRRTLPTDFPPPGTNGAVSLSPTTQASVEGTTFQQIPESIQSNIDIHRAVNQAESEKTNEPYGINITHLRKDPELRVDAENFMEGVIRPRIPSLSAAQTAPVPDNQFSNQNGSTDRPGLGVYSYNAAQLQQVAGDGIRISENNLTNQQQFSNQRIPVSQGQQPVIVPLHTSVPTTQAQAPGHVIGPQGQHQAQHMQHVVTNAQSIPHQQQFTSSHGVPVSNTGQLHQVHGGTFQQQHNNILPQAPAAVALNSHVQSQPLQHKQQQAFVHQPQPAFFHPQQQSVVTHQVQQQQAFVQQPQLTTLQPQQQSVVTQQVQGMPGQLHGQQQHLHYGQAPVQAFHGQQPIPTLSQQSQSVETDYCFEWMTDSTGRRILIRTPLHHNAPVAVHQPPQQAPVTSQLPVLPNQWQQVAGHNVAAQAQHHQQQRQPFVAPHPPTSRPQIVQYRTEFRCSPTTGQQWQVQVPVENSPTQTVQAAAAQFRNEWRIHPHTGVTYQVRVPVHSPAVPSSLVQQSVTPQTTPNQGQDTSCLGQDITQQVQQSFTQYCGQQHNNSTLSKHERVAGIVSLLDGGIAKKQPKVLEFAKTCPTKWSKQATATNINLPLYAWGAVAELEASLSGRSEAMPEGMLLGKLRHLKNTLEVCCLNSNASDFTAYGWTLARDYSTKVDNEVEQKLATWQDMPAGVKTSHLVSAQMENPRPLPKAPYDPKKIQSGVKEICTTYNKCTTDGKCEYEVAHPDKSCLRKHECSWCRSNKNQSWRHQARKCKHKEAGSGS